MKSICTYVETVSEEEQRTGRFCTQRAERRGGKQNVVDRDRQGWHGRRQATANGVKEGRSGFAR